MWWTFLFTVLSTHALDVTVETALRGSDCKPDLEYGEFVFERCGEASYFLVGNCESAAAEIRSFSEAAPACECSSGSCRTALSPHLSLPIQKLLKSPNPYNSILNCHNTTLHALGFRQGYKMSGGDLEYLLASPFCTKRVGWPGPGT